MTKGVSCCLAGGVYIAKKSYQTGKHLAAFLLLLIQQAPDHGGSLIARLAEVLPDGWIIDSGRVYRILRELEDKGYLTSQWVTEGNGAPIRTYRITPAGVGRLAEFAEEIRLRRDSLNRFLAVWEARDQG
ncbi:MAG: PadR family transcriptional regulator [Firmicutes bacterium]|nr:PadR family transcriptional regulator [Bacillota bacterium]